MTCLHAYNVSVGDLVCVQITVVDSCDSAALFLLYFLALFAVGMGPSRVTGTNKIQLCLNSRNGGDTDGQECGLPRALVERMPITIGKCMFYLLIAHATTILRMLCV